MSTKVKIYNFLNIPLVYIWSRKCYIYTHQTPYPGVARRVFLRRCLKIQAINARPMAAAMTAKTIPVMAPPPRPSFFVTAFDTSLTLSTGGEGGEGGGLRYLGEGVSVMGPGESGGKFDVTGGGENVGGLIAGDGESGGKIGGDLLVGISEGGGFWSGGLELRGEFRGWGLEEGELGGGIRSGGDAEGDVGGGPGCGIVGGGPVAV